MTQPVRIYPVKMESNVLAVMRSGAFSPEKIPPGIASRYGIVARSTYGAARRHEECTVIALVENHLLARALQNNTSGPPLDILMSGRRTVQVAHIQSGLPPGFAMVTFTNYVDSSKDYSKPVHVTDHAELLYHVISWLWQGRKIEEDTPLSSLPPEFQQLMDAKAAAD